MFGPFLDGFQEFKTASTISFIQKGYLSWYVTVTKYYAQMDNFGNTGEVTHGTTWYLTSFTMWNIFTALYNACLASSFRSLSIKGLGLSLIKKYHVEGEVSIKRQNRWLLLDYWINSTKQDAHFLPNKFLSNYNPLNLPQLVLVFPTTAVPSLQR